MGGAVHQQFECGNGALESYFEACDDGNTTDDENDCNETCERVGNCGDGVVDELLRFVTTATTAVMTGCELCHSNGILRYGVQQGNEACDDGNALNGDYCSSVVEYNGQLR